ncbi:hypothetical protein ACIGHN_13540 [Acidovorax sp. NPDC077693]|uniref:hypothetical protein n=1 Tax=unclassified Acidovorax TaxID=2684926 RepID=UPI0037C6A960
MTPKEMQTLRAAAAAAGLRITHWREPGGAYVTSATEQRPHHWDPENDSGHALELAALLRIPIWFEDHAVVADQRKCGDLGWRVEFGLYDGEREQAMRRAILKAAAHRKAPK